MISVVIPTYNRLNNLKLVLASLEAQRNPYTFEVIVADDGSTDGTRAYCEHYDGQLDLKHVWCGPHIGFRPHRTRNLGIANARGDWALFVDSDVVLNPDALEHHVGVRNKHPGIVIVGLYHFTDRDHKIDRDYILERRDLMEQVPKVMSKGPPVPGIDCRLDGFGNDMDYIITEYDGLGFFGGNVSWPVELWWKLGGMDELMPSGMGEDAELGQRMRLNNIPVLQYKPVWGVHLYHDRDWGESKRLVQESIYYIDKKYSIGQFAMISERDYDTRKLELAKWYTKGNGAKLIKVDGNDTVFAVFEEYYVGIPSPDWIAALGFTFDEVVIVTGESMKGLTYKGVIQHGT